MVDGTSGENHRIVVSQFRRVAPALVSVFPDVTARYVADDTVGEVLPNAERKVNLQQSNTMSTSTTSKGNRQKVANARLTNAFSNVWGQGRLFNEVRPVMAKARWPNVPSSCRCTYSRFQLAEHRHRWVESCTQ